ncbi:major facilitator superfamily domain-containing protein [Russula compacta]|nr:major facilitator superfamily domain-containing protein [Russula compacta]
MQEPLVPLTPHNPTPLPTTQITVLAFPSVAKCIMQHSINLPTMGGDGQKVGYYTGIIVSLHFAVEAVAALQWSRLSNHISHKPVILLCLMGTTISIILFGLSCSFWALILSQCLHGALKGNISIMKSFSLLLMTWALGIPICQWPPITAQNCWPHLFSYPFWAKYPYFLPCLVVAAFACLSFIIIAMFFKEPQPSRAPMEVAPQEGSSGELDASTKNPEKPLPLHAVLTRPIRISITNHAMLALLSMAALVLILLIWSTLVKLSRLDLNLASIGFIAVFAIIFVMFLLENLVIRRLAPSGGLTSAVIWLLILMQLASLSIHNMGYSKSFFFLRAMFMYISSSIPNKRSLGVAYGLVQTVASAQRAVGPAAVDWLFAFSLSNNVLGGNFAYVVLLCLVCIRLCVAVQLPRHTWAC